MTMSPTTKELQCFTGKICSILTPATNLSLTKADFPKWFTIRIDAIDDRAIFGTDLLRSKTKHVFFFPHVIGIMEEQVINADHPEYTEMKQKMEEAKKSDSAPVDDINNQANELRKKWSNE